MTRLRNPNFFEDKHRILYDLLQEREEHVNISHREMPSFEDHCEFVDHNPYQCWFFIMADDGEVAGSIYLTDDMEIGIFLFKKYLGMGFGGEAVKELMALYGPGRYVANIAPRNDLSQKFFVDMGFAELQRVYVKDVE